LANTGANWISVVVGLFQETVSSTSITKNQYKTASDQALRHIVELSHSFGIRVILVPFLTLSNDPEHSWVQIGSAFINETQWQQWFSSYRDQVNHYASITQEFGADMFYIGSELPGTTLREQDWRQVVKAVGERFKGPISYDSVFWGNPIPEYKRIKWWDVLDYVCTDFWMPLTNKNNPMIEELKRGWLRTGFLISREDIAKQFNKPAIISEIGYSNLDGVNTDPSGARLIGAAEDLQEQADCYQVALEMVWDKPWLNEFSGGNGMPFHYLYYGPAIPHGKPAENVLKIFYLLK